MAGLVLHLGHQDRLAAQGGRAGDPVGLRLHADDLGVRVLGDLPDQGRSVGVGHPVARFDALVGGHGRVEGALVGRRVDGVRCAVRLRAGRALRGCCGHAVPPDLGLCGELCPGDASRPIVRSVRSPWCAGPPRGVNRCGKLLRPPVDNPREQADEVAGGRDRRAGSEGGRCGSAGAGLPVRVRRTLGAGACDAGAAGGCRGLLLRTRPAHTAPPHPVRHHLGRTAFCPTPSGLPPRPGRPTTPPSGKAGVVRTTVFGRTRGCARPPGLSTVPCGRRDVALVPHAAPVTGAAPPDRPAQPNPPSRAAGPETELNTELTA